MIWPKSQPVSVPAGRLEFFIRGDNIRPRAEVIELRAGDSLDRTWRPELKPASATFSGLPDGTRLLVGRDERGVWPRTGSISVPAQTEVDVSMVAPDGTIIVCSVPGDLMPGQTYACRWQ